MNQPRRHHYCPAAYLANFATPCERTGRLFATDCKSANDRPSTPDNEGHQRDFYRIDVDDATMDPFGLEAEFNNIEGPAIAAIKSTILSDRLPSGADLNWIINFVGLLKVRVPKIRDHWAQAQQNMYASILKIYLSSKERYESVTARMKNDGHDIPSVSFEEMKEFVNSDRYEIKVARNSLLLTMLRTAEVATDLLLQRKWSLLVTDGTKEFITSDNPVNLRWIKPVKFFPPGLGLTNTEVSITLSPRHALIGYLKMYPEHSVLRNTT